LGARVAGEFGEHLRERLPGVLARGDGHQFRVRMVQQQPDEFLAGVTGRADDGDFFRFHFQKILTAKYTNTRHENFSFSSSVFNFRRLREIRRRGPKQKTPPD
jgi:hypothetical protein